MRETGGPACNFQRDITAELRASSPSSSRTFNSFFAPLCPLHRPRTRRHGIDDVQMCKWNLHKFAEALAPALPLADSKAALDKYDELFQGYYEEGMRRCGGFVAMTTVAVLLSVRAFLFVLFRCIVPCSALSLPWFGFLCSDDVAAVIARNVELSTADPASLWTFC